MMKEKLIQILEFILTNERILKYIKIIFQYSFIIWITIIGYIIFGFIKSYNVVYAEKQRQIKVYKTQRNILFREKNKLANIETSYKVLTQIFTSEEVDKMKQTLNREIQKVINQTRLNRLDIAAINPLKTEYFNIKIHYSRIFNDLPIKTLGNIRFTSQSTYYYKDYLISLYKNSQTPIMRRLNVYLNTQGEYLVLYAKSSGNRNYLIATTTKTNGFISDIFKYPAYLTASVLNNRYPYSTFLFGWVLQLNKEGKEQ
jgi:hypothetical protein